MTIEEFRNKVLEVKTPEWFNNIECRLSTPKINFNLSLKGITPIFEYVSQQASGWGEITEKLPPELEQVKDKFVRFRGALSTFLVQNISTLQQNLVNNWNNQIAGNFISINFNYIPYETPQVEFLINLYKNYPNYYRGAYDFIIGKNNLQHHINDTDNNYITGLLMAYEFQTKESSEILSRKSSEAAELINTKRDFQNYLNNSEKQILDVLNKVNAEKTTYTSSIDELKKGKELQFDEWFNKTKIDFTGFSNDSSKKIDELKTTYQAKLKLSEPAKYWEDRAVKLTTQGRYIMGLLILLIIIGGTCLYFLLWQTPEGMLTSIFDNDKTKAIRWSIVFITFISLIFLGIRYLSKVMFSSFHLARDAEERHQLTYVYLALIKDSAVDEKDRQLIMQAIFSRADTGLLKEDSSPTMPGSLDKFIRPS